MQAAMQAISLDSIKDWFNLTGTPATARTSQENDGRRNTSPPHASAIQTGEKVAPPPAPAAETDASPPASDSDHDRFLLGGHYVLAKRKPLGVGGYAKVLLAKHASTGNPVAVKVLSSQPVPGEGRGASSEAAVVREVAALRRAGQHEHVCCLYDHYRIGLEDALVLELCSGGELFGLIERQGALGEAEARELFRGMLSGLTHLHSVGIAHRDLKLENVLLGGKAHRTPKICDLGLAHVHPPSPESATGYAEQQLTQFCGSRSYCAPEVMGRLKYNGYAADCWCLGVCLFGLVAGFFPVDEASTRDWRFNQVAQLQHLDPTSSTCAAIFGFYQRTCTFTTSLAELCDGLLQVQPHRRWGLPHVAASAWVAGSTSAAAAHHAPAAGSHVAQCLHANDHPRESATLDIDELDGVLYRSVVSDLSAGEHQDQDAPTTGGPPPGRAPPSLHRQCALMDLGEQMY